MSYAVQYRGVVRLDRKINLDKLAALIQNTGLEIVTTETRTCASCGTKVPGRAVLSVSTSAPCVVPDLVVVVRRIEDAKADLGGSVRYSRLHWRGEEFSDMGTLVIGRDADKALTIDNVDGEWRGDATAAD